MAAWKGWLACVAVGGVAAFAVLRIGAEDTAPARQGKPASKRPHASLIQSRRDPEATSDALRELHGNLLAQIPAGTPAEANELLRRLRELEQTEKDDETRTTLAGERDALLRREVPRAVFRAMDGVIERRVREAPATDTFEDVRRWIARDLTPAVWKTAADELGLRADELEKAWKTREVETPRRATYGSGSFFVMKLKRSPLERDEAWWSGADAATRAAWTTACFVEQSGCFRIDAAENAPCSACDGRGGACRACNGCGEVRSVLYR